MPPATLTRAVNLVNPFLPSLRASADALDDGLPGVKKRPDFTIYTAGLTLGGEPSADGLLRVSAVGSSTIQDLQGDTMTMPALQDMTHADVGLLLFLNHMYNVPEDVAGHLYGSPAIHIANGIGDLLLDMLLYVYKDRIAAVARDIASGGRHGVSIGCMVTSAEWHDAASGELVDPDDIDFWDIVEGKVCLYITGVDPLEWSIVGIPANQRSWVQQGARGLLQRGLSVLADTSGGVDDDAAHAWAKQVELLAPLVRSFWPNDFSALVRESGVDSDRATKLLKLPSRKSRAQLIWTPSSEAWSLRDGARSAKATQTLTRADVGKLVASAAQRSPVTPLASESLLVTRAASDVSSESASGEQETEMRKTTTTDKLTEPLTEKTLDALDAQKGATGKASWPLAERDRAWDAGAAHKRIVAWAGGQDELSVAKMQSVHFWSPEGDAAQNVSDYKLLFCDVVDGDIKAVPRALMACWGGHGVDKSDIPDSDKSAIHKKLSAYAARMREEFDDDTIMPPWDKEDGAAPEYVEYDATALHVKGMLVKSDGSHDAYTGTHTHAHSAFKTQGGDETHSHEHTHDGDAVHDHHRAAVDDGDASEKDEKDKSADTSQTEAHTDAMVCCHAGEPCGESCTCELSCDCKSASVETTAPTTAGATSADAETVVTQSVTVGDDGTAYMPLMQTSATSADVVITSSASTTATGLTTEPPTERTFEDDLAIARAETAEKAQRAALLKTYQDMLAPLGFVVRELDTASETTASDAPTTQKASMDDDDAQELITCISAADGAIDRAMELLGIPDADEDDDDDTERASGDDAVTANKSLQRLILRTLGVGLALKAGKRHSAADMEKLQAIHDACKELTDGAVCKGVDDDGAGESHSDDTPTNAGTSDAPAPATTVLVGISALTEQLGALTASLGGLPALSALVSELDTRSASLRDVMTQYSAQAEQYSAHVGAMREHVEKLANMPLPRPTSTTRSVTATPSRIDPQLARYEDFFALPGGVQPTTQRDARQERQDASALSVSERRALLDAALAETRIVTRTHDGAECREWPAGVGADVRPPLTNEQRARMSFTDHAAYASGGAVLVPTYGEQLDAAS